MSVTARPRALAAVLAACAALVVSAADAEIDRDTIVGLWLFDENGGATVQDKSGGGHNGILKRKPVWAAGRYGGGLDLQAGTGSYVELEGSALDLPFGEEEPFTITAWVNPRDGGQVVTKCDGGLSARTC